MKRLPVKLTLNRICLLIIVITILPNWMYLRDSKPTFKIVKFLYGDRVPYLVNANFTGDLVGNAAAQTAAVDRAANAWSTTASANFRFFNNGTTNATAYQGLDGALGNVEDNDCKKGSRKFIILITMQNTIFQGEPNPDNPNAIGGALTWSCRSEIVHFDIFLSRVVNWNSRETFDDQNAQTDNGIDLQSVVTHELGHSLGLNHSRRDGEDKITQTFPGTDPDATLPIANRPTMAWAMFGTDEGRSLEDDDIAGIQALYGLSITAIATNFENAKVTLSETSYWGPGLSFGNSQLFLSWTGIDDINSINVVTSNDAINFFNKVTLNETSIASPPLAFNGRLFIAWAGIDDEYKLNVMSSTDGETWVNKVTFSDTSVLDPIIVAGNGRIYIAWTGRDPAQSINVMSSADGITWVNKITLGETSILGPALAFGNDRLFLGWIGTNSEHQLNVMSSADGVQWQNKVVLGETSVNGIALTFGTDNFLYMAWTGREDKRINLLKSTDGINFNTKVTSNETSLDRPALTWGNSRLYLGWTGTDNRLNVLR